MTTTLILMTPEHRARTLTDESLARLSRCGPVLIASNASQPDREDVLAMLADADAVMTGTGTGKLTPNVLDAAPRLRAVIHAAGSVRPIVDADVYDRGIQVSSQAAANALPVAEYTLAMILLELKGVPEIAREYRAARTAVDVDGRLADHGNYSRTVGIISASTIGRRVIGLLQPFDLEVLVYDPYLDADDARHLGARSVELQTLLSTSDLVSMHTPLLPETAGMIGAAELAALRDGAVFINTARGALVDQQALISELRTGRIRAVIDVTEPEIPEPDSPLWDLPNLVLTPHVAGSRGRELHRIGEQAVVEVERLTRGEPLLHGVPRERYSTNA
jgi:phosphoglycerate dehydrogenase-like enzyme